MIEIKTAELPVENLFTGRYMEARTDRLGSGGEASGFVGVMGIEDEDEEVVDGGASIPNRSGPPSIRWSDGTTADGWSR
jgi:hypothetical protein